MLHEGAGFLAQAGGICGARGKSGIRSVGKEGQQIRDIFCKLQFWKISLGKAVEQQRKELFRLQRLQGI